MHPTTKISGKFQGKTFKILSANKGFTLLEILICVGIFMVIGVASWQILSQSVRVHQQLQTTDQILAQLQKGLWIMGQDIRQAVDRPIRDEYGVQEAAMTSLQAGYHLILTRQGWANPLQERRSELQRIGYRLGHDPQHPEDNDTHLLRDVWPRLDRDTTSQPLTQVLIHHVQALHISFLDHQARYLAHWPFDTNTEVSAPNESNATKEKEDQAPPLPSGLLLEIDTLSHGQIKRVFALQGPKGGPS